MRPLRDLGFCIVEQRSIDRQLLHIDAIQLEQVLERRLEERKLIAFPVDAEDERQTRIWLAPERVKDLDPDVDVAIRLAPRTLHPVERVRQVRPCVRQYGSSAGAVMRWATVSRRRDLGGPGTR